MRSPLEPDTRLDVQLSAICGRNQYTREPESVLAELAAAAGARSDILARVAGIWAGYFESPERQPLVDSLLTLDGASPWAEIGRKRRSIPTHGAPIA